MQSGSASQLGAKLMRMLDEFATFSDEPGRLTRLYLSPAHRLAAHKLVHCFERAGLTTSIDAVGNVVGRMAGTDVSLPTLIVGSHIDTVRNAGKFDGNLGVLAPLVAIEELLALGERLPYSVELVAFGDEEGVRFPNTFSGSRAIAGSFDLATLDMRDQNGVSLAEALREFGCDPSQIRKLARTSEKTAAYLELHIEQGPVLESKGLPVGIVTAISGATRLGVTVQGTAGHAGTVPMHMRRDAAAGAAAMILEVEKTATQNAGHGLVATVGIIEIPSGAVNVIPGLAKFTIDIRAPTDEARFVAIDNLRGRCRVIAEQRGLSVEFLERFKSSTTVCEIGVMQALSDAAARLGVHFERLPSGAGHDAMIVASLCPIGMLFLRCKGGISHNPAESITESDAGMAVSLLIEFLRGFEARPARRG
jgi:hydantoinase/carbamoylase family amidase